MFGGYGAYIIPAYGLTALIIAGLIIRVQINFRRQRREIARLEQQGIRRRSKKARDD
jgi:heme exporter protein D